jgi:uncharacterized membrane protein
MRIASVGHAFFAAAMILIGILGLLKGDFAVIWQPVPDGVPARAALIYLCALVALATGIGLLFRRTAAIAARVLLAYLLLWLLLLRVPTMLISRTVDFWWAAAKISSMAAAAWVLYVRFADDGDRRRFGFAASDKGLYVARVLYALAMIAFGVAHFVYPEPTAGLVPRWLPWHLFWAYFFGGTFIAAGVAVSIGVFARLAAALSALEIGMFLVLVWVPIAAAGGASAFQWDETVVSIVLTAAAWVVAESYRGMSWLGVNQR